MERIIDGKDKLFTCKEILQETATVMSRPKFKVTNEYITHFIRSIEDIANQISLTGEIQNVCRDRDDDKILECALLADVDYIISGDDDLLILKKLQKIKIVTAKEYLEKTNL
jgi:putative PIN family toxin of toxin-antitoxin system